MKDLQNIKLNAHPVRTKQPEQQQTLLFKTSHMKKIYPLFLPFISFLITACSKDFLKSYDKRITGGTWELYDINSFGIGGRYNSPFTNGYFTFQPSGDLEYKDLQGNVYEGSWNIRWERRSSDDARVRSLFITVVNFQTQDVKTEYFDEINFTGTNRFKAHIYGGGRNYTFKFKR